MTALAGLPVVQALAAAPLVGESPQAFYRFMVGTFEVTTISDGTLRRPVDAALVKNAANAGGVRSAWPCECANFRSSNRVPAIWWTEVCT